MFPNVSLEPQRSKVLWNIYRSLLTTAYRLSPAHPFSPLHTYLKGILKHLCAWIIVFPLHAPLLCLLIRRFAVNTTAFTLSPVSSTPL